MAASLFLSKWMAMTSFGKLKSELGIWRFLSFVFFVWGSKTAVRWTGRSTVILDVCWKDLGLSWRYWNCWVAATRNKALFSWPKSGQSCGTKWVESLRNWIKEIPDNICDVVGNPISGGAAFLLILRCENHAHSASIPFGWALFQSPWALSEGHFSSQAFSGPFEFPCRNFCVLFV